MNTLDDLFQIISKKEATLSSHEFGRFLQDFMPQYFKQHSLNFDLRPPEKSYSRHYIGHQNRGLEALIMDWKEEGVSSVHGHPDFLFYYVHEGSITMRIFTEKGGKAIYKKTITLNAGEGIFHVGKKGKFNNFIHQVIAKEPSKSLHIYSDDALKGTVYSPENTF